MPGSYYEDGLSVDTRNLHRAILSLEEELEAINAYNQRMDVTDDEELKELLRHNRDEEIEHASMLMEWLRRRMPKFDEELGATLFAKGSITAAEKGAGDEDGPEDASGAASLGLGSLKTKE